MTCPNVISIPEFNNWIATCDHNFLDDTNSLMIELKQYYKKLPITNEEMSLFSRKCQYNQLGKCLSAFIIYYDDISFLTKHHITLEHGKFDNFSYNVNDVVLNKTNDLNRLHEKILTPHESYLTMGCVYKILTTSPYFYILFEDGKYIFTDFGQYDCCKELNDTYMGTLITLKNDIEQQQLNKKSISYKV